MIPLGKYEVQQSPNKATNPNYRKHERTVGLTNPRLVNAGHQLIDSRTIVDESPQPGVQVTRRTKTCRAAISTKFS
jgi:hypothetical protein